MAVENGGRTILWRGWRVLIAHRYRASWAARQYKLSLPLSLALFVTAVAANTMAGFYATERASNSVTDIILSNIPVFDVDYIFVFGGIAVIAFVVALLFAHPRRMPFVLCALGLFYITRAVFVTLTHLGPYPEHAVIDFQSKIILALWGGGDEFFSGHTGAPFMLALVFWREKWLRYTFLAISLAFAAIVLLGHLHYSIDVLSAFFITYAIYHLALYMFPREHALFEGAEQGAAESA